MKKIYFVRCMKNRGELSYSVIDNKRVVFKCNRYSELVSFLKDKLSYLNRIGMILVINAPKVLSSLCEDVYSYEY